MLQKIGEAKKYLLKEIRCLNANDLYVEGLPENLLSF